MAADGCIHGFGHLKRLLGLDRVDEVSNREPGDQSWRLVRLGEAGVGVNAHEPAGPAQDECGAIRRFGSGLGVPRDDGWHLLQGRPSRRHRHLDGQGRRGTAFGGQKEISPVPHAS